jgi:hypothetical protein
MGSLEEFVHYANLIFVKRQLADPRLDPQQRERFFKAGLKAALRLEQLQFRVWLLRRVRTTPLAAPIDPAAFAISDRGMATLLKNLVGEPPHPEA